MHELTPNKRLPKYLRQSCIAPPREPLTGQGVGFDRVPGCDMPGNFLGGSECDS